MQAKVISNPLLTGQLKPNNTVDVTSISAPAYITKPQGEGGDD
jgi:hypothetical protein